MKFLTILRHAKSSWDNPLANDLVRPLNDRGVKSIPIMAGFLKEKGIRPDLIITSPATRALQTALEIGQTLGYPREKLDIEQQVYFGTGKDILSVIRKKEDTLKDILLVGHEPVLSALIEQLTGTTLEKFPTCAVYRISFKADRWKAITAEKGKCEFFVNPKLLMEK